MLAVVDTASAPPSLLPRYELARHPRIDRLRGEAQRLIGELESLAEQELSPTWEPDVDETEANEFWRALLERTRQMHHDVREGGMFTLFQRQVKKHAPDLDPKLRTARDRAAAKLGEMRAFLAVLVDENDDAELGIDVAPQVVEAAPPGPSEPLDLEE